MKKVRHMASRFGHFEARTIGIAPVDCGLQHTSVLQLQHMFTGVGTCDHVGRQGNLTAAKEDDSANYFGAATTQSRSRPERRQSTTVIMGDADQCLGQLQVLST